MWFTETPWPPLLILACAGLVFSALWVTSQRSSRLFIALACFAACPAVWFIEQSIVTESERVEQRIHDLAENFRLKNEEVVLSYISEQAVIVRALALNGMSRVDYRDNYRITDVNVDMRAEETLAISTFRFNAEVSWGSTVTDRHVPTRWRVHWQKIAGNWQIVEVHRLAVVGDEELDPMALRE